MCLGVPAAIIEMDENARGKVSIAGTVREACLDLVPEAKVGDWVLLHAGFAIQVLDPDAAAETLELLREVGLLAADGSSP